MKNFLNITLVLVILFSITSPVLADEVLARKITPHTGSALVTGLVFLQVSNPGKVSSVEEIFYKGHETSYPIAPRKISVAGTYSSGNSVELTETAKDGESYKFILPVIESVLSTFTLVPNPVKLEEASVTATFNRSSTDSVGTVVSVQEINASMKAKNVIVSRKGNKAKVSGSLLGTGAKGRFSLKFVF